MARLVESLVRLRDQIDEEWPDRSTASDGWIGDRAHAARRSDHNPDDDGDVHAIDVTAPVGHEVAEALRLSQDPRIKYMIAQRQICSSYDHANGPAWEWRPYYGSNPHTKHAHFSVVSDDDLAEDDSDWEITEMTAGHQHPHPDPQEFQHPGFEEPFNRLRREGVFTKNTLPGDIVEIGQLAVYLDTLLDLVADMGSGEGVTLEEVRADLVQRLKEGMS